MSIRCSAIALFVFSDCNLDTSLYPSLKEDDLSSDIFGSKKTNENLVIGCFRGMSVHLCLPGTHCILQAPWAF